MSFPYNFSCTHSAYKTVANQELTSLCGAGNVEILHGTEGEGALHLAPGGLQGGLIRQGTPKINIYLIWISNCFYKQSELVKKSKIKARGGSF